MSENVGRLPVFTALPVNVRVISLEFIQTEVVVIFSQKPQSRFVPLHDLGAVMVEAIVAIMESITETRYSLSKLDQRMTAKINTYCIVNKKENIVFYTGNFAMRTFDDDIF